MILKYGSLALILSRFTWLAQKRHRNTGTGTTEKIHLPTRQIKRLRIFGLIKRVSGTYRYYLAKPGRAAIAACVHATEFTIPPALATQFEMTFQLYSFPLGMC